MWDGNDAHELKAMLQVADEYLFNFDPNAWGAYRIRRMEKNHCSGVLKYVPGVDIIGIDKLYRVVYRDDYSTGYHVSSLSQFFRNFISSNF